jgi:hypothetical protein
MASVVMPRAVFGVEEDPGTEPEVEMGVPLSIAEILDEHVVLELESIDRMYLNLYVPRLQYAKGVVGYLRYHCGYPIASSALLKPITDRFVSSIKEFSALEGVPMVAFEKGQRKDDVMQERLKGFAAEEGVVFIGKAQEKAPVFRTERRRNPETGRKYPWFVRSTAMVNYYYFYCVDKNFGPFFLKFCSYFPYTAKLCLNGHEYLKRQLNKRGIGYEPLDNGILSCEDPKRAQAICDDLSAMRIERFARKWFRRLPHPYSVRDRQAGYTYDVSVRQCEFALTQIFDRPSVGRILFEQVIRENLDLGRPDKVRLIFNRRVTKRTPGRFQTRVLTNGVTPTIHVSYKHSDQKQYYKLGRGLRTEHTMNDPTDFGIGKRLENLPAMREIGFAANRRMLDVEKVSHDCTISEEVLDQVVRPIEVNGQRASALRFDDKRVQALFSLLVCFSFQPHGMRRRDLREPLAHLLGIDPSKMTPGRLTYDLRRLRLHGIIERIENSHRYRLTAEGLRIALFFSRTYARLIRPGLDKIMRMIPLARGGGTRLEELIRSFDREIGKLCREVNLTAPSA